SCARPARAAIWRSRTNCFRARRPGTCCWRRPARRACISRTIQSWSVSGCRSGRIWPCATRCASPTPCIRSSSATLIRGLTGSPNAELTLPLAGAARNVEAELFQPAQNRIQQFVIGIEGLLPVHDAAKVVGFHEGRLGGDRFGIVIGDERVRAGVPQPRRIGLRIPMAHIALLADEIRLQFRPGDFTDELLVWLVK